MGTLKDLKQELDENIEHYVEGLISFNKIGNRIDDATIRGLGDLLKLAQSKAIDKHLGLGYDSSKEQPELEKYQHDDCVSDSRTAPRTDMGGQ